jgi:nicotinate dehydrogenase subunit B
MTEAEPPVTLVVNGQRHQVEAPPTTMLMHVLRNDLGCTGVRAGCSIGECGACRVLVDGDSVPSCQTPVSEAVGTEVVTPEGLGGPDAPHPVQQAFLDEQAGQCGYCVNGMIVSVAARLEHEPDVDADGLRRTLDQHLCRCGTHVRMLRAACRAAGLDHRRDTDVASTRAGVPDEEFELPAAVVDQPRISRWIELRDDGHVQFFPGKVELGQGLRTAFAQIVASQLGVPLDRVHASPTTTERSPDQGQTSGTFSVEHGGTALAMAARALRRVLVRRAAEELRQSIDEIHLDADGAIGGRTGQRLSFERLAALGPVDDLIEKADRPKWQASPLGSPAPRDDLLAKLTGAPAYVHDLELPGMLHARSVLPPAYDAAPEDFDADTVREASGVVEVVHDGRLIVIVTEREEQAIRAQDRLSVRTEWRRGPGIAERDTERLLRSLPTQEYVRRRDDDVESLLGSLRTHSATYLKPYQAHGPMSPSAAVAVQDDETLRIWTHSQGIFPLRRELATYFGIEEERLVIEHVDGPGCYGLTCADDAALLAAIAARAVPGRPVRFQFSVSEEFGWDPYGPGMVADLKAGLDDEGAIRAWKCHAITDSHSTRPTGAGDRLLASWLTALPAERPWVGHGEPSARNALPLYDIPQLDVTAHGVRGPLRTGPLRSLGAFFNVFAAESFVDELAELARTDPVAFRLQHLRDERAAQVLELAAEHVGWKPHVGPSGRGLGVALARYKDTKAYVAEVAEVTVDPEAGTFAVVRVVVACDAGTIVNRDGLENQLEGGVIQGLSRTLHEELHLAEDGVRERDWTTYPRIGFAEVPPVEIVLVDRPGYPPLGAGEVSTPQVPAAVGNAIDDAVGVRLRRLPFTPAQLGARLVELDEQESRRVLFSSSTP